ncbi:hypothetical protein [Solidesulfovibrio fructosivorans]|uniref:hypothetical protein n=1 Tax=Solidesulfovibrio fructosivorans TaxID=878 RepID=UPI0005C1A219|nr:hypothetical protein [Solidesulfovibrio fructosivorans]
MCERMDLEMLEGITKSIGELKEIERDNDSITFKYRDKDGDDIPGFIQLLNEERAVATILMSVPDTHSVSAMIVSNIYNNDHNAHGTFAYTTKVGDDKWIIALESHIGTRGGVEDAAIRHQLRRLVDQINAFERTMVQGIQDVGPDSSFLKSGFWEALGSLAGGFFRGYSS